MISVVIPNWNGEKLLRKNLPKILAALPRNTEVIIVDDGSTDGSKKYLRNIGYRHIGYRKNKNTSKFLIRVIFNDRNRGFIYSCNRGVKEAKGEFVVLLNNDVVPHKGFLEAALKRFDDAKVFAVSFCEQEYGWAKIWWRGGFIHHGVGGRGKRSHISAWASGGSAIYRKSIWQELGGFDNLYHPFYWEDFDLGYRAWKVGYKIIWDPKAIVEHRHESTISKLNKNYVSLVKERNQLLFIWKNIDDFWLKLSHPFGLLLRVLTGPNYLKVIWAAWRQYRRFGKPKGNEKVRSDREILKLFKN